MRYMMGSRMLKLGDAMSILARRVRAPSGNSPAFMRVNRSRFSAMPRLRYGLSLPGSVGVPRYSWISSAVRSQTYALPALIIDRKSTRLLVRSVEILGDAAIAVRAFLAGLGGGAAILVDFIGGKIADIRLAGVDHLYRSEERRVGKESRSGWSP